jgi:hypothetical protein
MSSIRFEARLAAFGIAGALLAVVPAPAEARKDSIADILAGNRGNVRPEGTARPGLAEAPAAQSGSRTTGPAAPARGPAGKPAAQAEAEPKDPRSGDVAHEQARRLMKAIDAILQDTARNRSEARKLPPRSDFLVPPIFTETREDREAKVKDLMDATLAIVTDVPVVEVQKRIETLRRNIRELDDRIVKLREKQLTAPKDGFMPGYVTDTVDSLKGEIEDAQKRIAANREGIAASKAEVYDGLARSGVKLTADQVDLLLDGVLSGDLVRLVAVFSSAKAIDSQLAQLMAQSGENAGAARRYFAMHAALFAMVLHAQDLLIAKIDTQYLPKLEAIGNDIAAARQRTSELLRGENRPDQRRALEANRESQRLAEEAAKGYRRYLMQQREQVARARKRAAHDLRIADNTYETVEASYQLRQLMRDSATSFEAIQKLEAPTFDQIFRNEELRREFENLTRKLDQPSS